MKFKNSAELAKYAIKYFLDTNSFPLLEKKDVPKKLIDNKACFVTVYVKGDLRGCIGNYIPEKPLYLGIIDNAVRASRLDPRFHSITKNDISDLEVQVTVLSPLKKYIFKNEIDLIKFLSKEKPGVMIKKGFERALFLPQVWEKLPEPQVFLSELCIKGGLNPDDWKKDANFWIFYEDKSY